MAPVIDTAADTTDRRDRAQLLLVSAIVIAVTFVALAVILNSVIFTQNLSTRSIDVGASEALEGQNEIDRGAGTLMDRVNDPGTSADYGTLTSTYATEFDTWRGELSKYGALQGQSVRVDIAETGAGTDRIARGTQVVHDNTSTDLTPRGGTPVDWIVAEDVRARHFTLTVAGANETSQSTVETGLADGTWDDDEAFQIDIVRGGTSRRTIGVYNDSGNGITVTVRDHTAGTTLTCSRVEDPTVRIDVGRGTIQGEPCGALRIDDLAGSGPYTVRLANADNVTGAFQLTADRPINASATENGTFTDPVDTANHGDHCSGPTYFAFNTNDDFPFTAPAMYGAELNLDYRGRSVEYEGTPRVERDELEGEIAHTPKFRSVTVTDNSGTSASFDVDWTVADPDADLGQVEVKLQEVGLAAGVFNDTSTDSAISGRTASGSTTVQNSNIVSNYDIHVVVEDAEGNQRTVVRRHAPDGDDSGCPP